jgi:hypothetical protein
MHRIIFFGLTLVLGQDILPKNSSKFFEMKTFISTTDGALYVKSIFGSQQTDMNLVVSTYNPWIMVARDTCGT